MRLSVIITETEQICPEWHGDRGVDGATFKLLLNG
jgi:hypothetical protein